MATGAHAVERIAQATGILPATVFRAAKVLREYDTVLWPEAGRGGGKAAAHVEPSHLVNLVLALAVADPITKAPMIVKDFRNTWQHGFEKLPQDAQAAFAAWGFLTTEAQTSLGLGGGYLLLGDALENIVDLLTRPEVIGSRRDEMVRTGLEVRLTTGGPLGPLAFISESGNRGMLAFYSAQQGLLSDLMPRNRLIPLPARLEAPLERRVTLPLELFQVMAELWSDTKEHRRITELNRGGKRAAPLLPLSDVLPGTPENETAASLPGEAAAVADQLVTGKPLVGEAHGSDVRENSQGAIESRAGRSSILNRDDTHERCGTGGADSAAA